MTEQRIWPRDNEIRLDSRRTTSGTQTQIETAAKIVGACKKFHIGAQRVSKNRNVHWREKHGVICRTDDSGYGTDNWIISSLC